MTRVSDWTRNVKTGSGFIAATGIAATVVLLGSFGAWAALAPLSGAAIAPGVVAAAGLNQRIQHLDGGMISRILVKEGDRVTLGQPLVELDATAAKAANNRLMKQIIALSAMSRRLIAERDGLEKFEHPAEAIQQAKEYGVLDTLLEQNSEFVARRERYRLELGILGQRLDTLAEQIEGMKAQQSAVEQQLAVVRDEVGRKQDLLDKGLTNRSELTMLLRSEADLLGQLGQAKSAVLTAQSQIMEAREQMARHQTMRVESAIGELNRLRSELLDTQEQQRASDAVLQRVVLRAPADGIVIRMNYNSQGSVIAPGTVVLELLPTSDELVVEARLSLLDVDVVAPGQQATLRFSSLNTSVTPTVEATVIYLSADRLVDPATQQPYYAARLKISDELPPGVEAKRIYPGMPVEVYFMEGERTFLDYLLKPLLDSMSRAFRET